ncbi:2-C-methyl-D-erythritol 2,4-cyclodiphosphate synthase [Fibrobacterota bacterium]
MIKVGIGQDSHRIIEGPGTKRLLLGGVGFEEGFYLDGNSDADVVLHSVTNGISGITGIPVLGAQADEMCRNGITDSRYYLERALQDLERMDYQVAHISISIECRKPRIMPKVDEMRGSIAEIVSLTCCDVAVTATSGENLSDFGKGLGIQSICAVTARVREKKIDHQ